MCKQTWAIIDIVQIIQHFKQKCSKKYKQTKVLPSVPIFPGVTRNRFFWLHRAFRICSTWHVFCPCFDKKRLRDLPRQITRHDWNYLYLWEFPMHSTDNTNSSFLLTLISILILSLLTLSVQSESCLQLQFMLSICYHLGQQGCILSNTCTNGFLPNLPFKLWSLIHIFREFLLMSCYRNEKYLLSTGDCCFSTSKIFYLLCFL